MRSLLIAAAMLVVAGCAPTTQEFDLFDEIDEMKNELVCESKIGGGLYFYGTYYQNASPVFCEGELVDSICYTVSK